MESQILKELNGLREPVSGHYIVAVGASAGGLEAIHEFFDNMTHSEELSFIIIQHLSPDYKSLLVELLAKHTRMIVREAEQDMVVEKNCIYVIPNKFLLTLQDGKLHLQDKSASNIPNTAIDTFLRSLANDNGSRSIAIILSGTGTDGTRGIDSIKDAGGMVMVQDPQSAKFDGMPNSAIASGNVDYILAPAEMPAEIARYIELNNQDDIQPAVFASKKLEQVLTAVKGATGYDFHYYKTPTILRRLARRMLQLDLRTADDYLDYLKDHPEECKRLSKEFLIGVTRFFRDAEAFEVLDNSVIPAILSAKEDGEMVKVWVTACSTGEEAYSIAILIDQHIQRSGRNLSVKIFATDIDPLAIEFASKGMYPQSVAKDLEPDILDRYFARQGSNYVVIPRLRKYVVFARHNIFKDPPFIKNDMVTCRNMLIYMNSALQKKILHTLHFSLNEGGYLFLGPSENVTIFKPYLDEVSAKWKLYRKTSNARPFTGQTLFGETPYDRQIPLPKKPMAVALKPSTAIVESLKDVLSEEFNCAAIHVDENFELKEATGDFSRYLSLPEKKLNLNILHMIAKDLSPIIHEGLRKLQKTEHKVVLRNVKFNFGGQTSVLDIVLKRIISGSDSPHSLIVIKDQKQIVPTEKPASNGQQVEEIVSEPGRDYVEDLEAELKETRLNLYNAIESLESANEELQSNNEELLSANEELQSSNEELQSLNEELHTLNSEHQLKIRELIELNDDLNNYFRSTDIGQIFLDKNLRIRKFNPAAVRLVNLIDNDIGRPISHISTNIRYDDLMRDIDVVMRNNDITEKEVQLSNMRIVLMRILPYVRQDKQVEGVVVTFVDITSIKEMDKVVKAVFNLSKSAIMVFRAVRNEKDQVRDFLWLASNKTAQDLLGTDPEKEIGKFALREGAEIMDSTLFNRYVTVVETGKQMQMEKALHVNGKQTWFDINAARLNDGIIITFTDISEKKSAEERLRRNYNELVGVKENLRNLNIALEDKVNERTRKLAESEERFRLVSKATNDAIWDWNLVQNEVWWNENFYNITGYDPSKPFTREQWLETIHPSDRKNVNQSLIHTINHGHKQWTVEYRFMRADGSYARILDRGYLLSDQHDTPYRMLGSMLDVSELRQAEEAIAQNIEQRKFLAESMPLIVWTANMKGEVDFLNQQFMLFTGVPIEEGLGRGWESVVHPDDLQQLRALWKTSIVSKRDFSLEIRLRKFDDTYRWYLLRARAGRNGSGQSFSWVGSNTEIHEQKLAREILEQRVNERTQELHQMNQELESSNIELQQFAFVASHDLKEPLRKINMFSLIVKDKYLKDSESQAKYLLERIINSSTRMTRLVNDLLDFSRLSITQLFEETDLNQVISEILADLELVIIEKKADIRMQTLPTIQAVPAQMRQVFQNIISNAIKFSKKGVAPEINISASIVDSRAFDAKEDSSGEYCRLTITDNGIGFEEQYASKIFTIFQRLHTKESYEGTGIGLAITKKIIEKHNGIITARSVFNEGSTFIIVLPIQQSY